MQSTISFAKRCLYLLAGKIPWYPGYNEYRIAEIQRALDSPSVMASFRNGETLPKGYGIGIDERIVEYPWLFSRLGVVKTLLDAGGTLNHQWVLRRREFGEASLHIFTLAPESYFAKSEKVSYVYGDLRSTIFGEGKFDAITCISTLEHIGMDNTLFYTAESRFAEEQASDYLQAIDEFRRMVRVGGKVFISVPFGVTQNHGWFQQFNSSMIQAILHRFQATAVSLRYYRYSVTGWQLSCEEACRDAIYFDFHRDGRRRNADNAAAARAVACIELVR